MSDTNSAAANAESETSHEKFDILKATASVVASLTLILILLGFGFSLSIESRMALPHASLYESSTELLDLGSMAVVTLFGKLSERMAMLSTYLDLAGRAWHSLWPALLIVLICYPVFIYFKGFNKAGESKLSVKSALTAKGWRGHAYRALALAITSLFMLASPILIYFGLILAMVMLAIVPIIGMAAGGAFLDEMAFKNMTCAPLPSVAAYAAQKTKPAGGSASDPGWGQCVRIAKDDGEGVSGFLIVSTSKMAVLYLPNGVARRVPLADSTVEVIDKLPDVSNKATPSDDVDSKDGKAPTSPKN